MGLLTPAADRLGGVAEAVELDTSAAPSRTFHGRDLFAPAAARLAAGTPLSDLGDGIGPTGLVRLDVPYRPTYEEPDTVTATVLTVDRFGNLSLGAQPADIGDAQSVALEVEQSVPGETEGTLAAQAPVTTTFADVARGELLLLVDSNDRLALCVNGGSAAELLGVHAGERVRIHAIRPRIGR